MSCQQCTRGSKHCSSYNHSLNYGPQYYSDVAAESEGLEDEPVAPTLSLGNRILWLTEAFAASGIVRWIGRIPSVSANWTAGIEFDNVMPDGGNGDFQNRSFFNSRPGHSLFLPVAELIKVDDSPASPNSERTSFFGRLHDTCSNFAHRRRRDSTFGHFKQECYSTCAQNEFHCNGHHYSHAPVYDRITSRRSLRYDDHPYETYNVCVPCGTLQSGRGVQPGRGVQNVRAIRNEPFVVEPDERIHSLRADDRIQQTRYHEEEMGNIEMVRKDSIFNPRASLKLISGFKDWVSCLIQGTTRRRSKGKLILKDRKSVTSVLLTNSSQSQTGQRLSSFSEYASVSVSRAQQNEEESTSRVSQTRKRIVGQIINGQLESQNAEQSTNSVSQTRKRIVGQIKNDQLESSSSFKAAGRSRPESLDSSDQVLQSRKRVDGKPSDVRLEKDNSLKTSSRSRKKSSKKRPAPQPPCQPLGTNHENKLGRDINRRTDHGVQDFQRGNKYVTKTVMSTSLVSHSVPLKKKYKKKRRAPPPPSVLGTDESSIYAAVHKKDRRNVQNRNSNYDNLRFPSVRQRHATIQGSEEHEHFSRRKRKPMHRQLRRMPNISTFVNSNSTFARPASDDSSSSGSISFSPDESEDEKYGLVKYSIDKAIDGESSGVNYLQYAGENSDVCLKISIQKTETNVVTVEEVSQPRTVRYTIEEDTSSSSELSDEPPIVPVKLKAIAAPPELKQDPPDDSSASIEDGKEKSADDSPASTEDSKEDSKTIFDELNLAPPAKGTVKDFVQAFNMLATKGSENGSPPKNIQSFPTKWEFQNSKAFPSNQFLLPIAEESVNETSEQDGNVSVDEDTFRDKHKKNGYGDRHHSKHRLQNKENNRNEAPKQEHTPKELSTRPKAMTNHLPDPNSTKHSKSDKGSDDKCSHCSEKHSTKTHPKCQRKRTAPRMDKTAPKKEQSSSQAHVAALSSLLQEGTVNEIPNGSLKLDSKSDQPIMVGLYIEDKSSHRGPMPLLITPSMSLKKLKKQVEKEYDLPRHQQCWILGQSFAVRDEASLASYGVREAGCPVLLYVMSQGPKASSLPCRAPSRNRALQGHSTLEKEAGSLAQKTEQKESRKGELKPTTSIQNEVADKSKETNKAKNKSDHHRLWEEEFEKKADYRDLVALDDVDLVANVELFECPVCFLEVGEGEGAVLQECLHSFCRECLASSIQYSDTAIIRCPFANEDYSCESHLQEREIKCLVTEEVYERHLARSMALAESQAQDSFHCKTPDCPGWCLFEDNANTFLCPVCKRTNCLTCAAVHEGRNCRQYQDSLAFDSDTSEEARKTREYLREMVSNGEAMECPKCQVILMKKWGCDWLKCSMCHSEVCWVTKGPRWGPGGRGDTSGGCKCMLNGVRCHPKCSYCH